MITKDGIFTKISEIDIFKHYLKTEDFSKHVKSPFAKDKTPSLKIYEDTKTFKCFSSGYQGDCFQFVAYLKELDCKTNFPAILQSINTDLNLNLNSNKDKSSSNFTVKHKTLSKQDISFWKQFKVDEKTLKKFNVCPVDSFNCLVKGKPKDFKIFKDVLAFDFIVNNRHKVYIPDQPSKKVKKQFYKNQSKDDIFGLSHLPANSKYIIICAGEKDCLVLNSNGFPAISFQSESSLPSHSLIRQLKEKCTQLFICYDNDSSGKENSKKISSKFNIPSINLPDKYNDIAEYFSKNNAESFNLLVEKSLSDFTSLKSNSIFIKDHCYFKKSKNQDFKLTNFLINVIALVNSKKNPRRIIQIITENEKTNPLEFPVSAFISKQSFRLALEAEGDFFFFGNDSDLMELKTVIFSDSDTAREISDLGFDNISNSFILSNGIISNNKFFKPDQFGLAYPDDNKGLYIPSASVLNLNDEEFSSNHNFKFIDSEVTFDDWYKSFEDVYGTNSIFYLSYLMSSLNFDIITQQTNCFPLLMLFGSPRSGKTTLAKSLLSLFGIPQEPIPLPNATQSAISSKLSNFKNSLSWLDEYDNSLHTYIDNTLRGLFDLQGRLRKTYSNDNKTYSSRVLNGTILSGQESPIHEALLSRCLCFQFTKQKYTRESSENLSHLQTLETKGLGRVLSELLSYRDYFINDFKTQYHYYLDFLNTNLQNKNNSDNSDDLPALLLNVRLLQSYSIILASLSIYIKNGLTINSSLSINQVYDLFFNHIMFQIDLESESNELNSFWEIFTILADKGFIKENVDYSYDSLNDTLSFKPSIFDQYRKYMFTTTGKWGLHKSTLQSYLKSESYFIKKTTVKFYTDNYHKTTRKPSHAYQFCYSEIPINLHLHDQEQNTYKTSSN